MFFTFFMMTDWNIVIPEVIAQIFNPIVELTIPTGKAVNEGNGEIET